MSAEALKLTAYFGERDRAGDRFLADAFSDIHARHELATSLVLRGAFGFGAKQHLRSDRQLTLSEDLPVVSVAVDRRERIEAAFAEVERLRFDGLVTLERARMLPWEATDEQSKLTVYLGRHERSNGRPAHEAVVELLRRHGVAGATVLLGVDGTADGVRRRAGFLSRNAAVPLMVIAVGDGRTIAAALPELERLLARPLATLERLHVLKRDGRRLGELPGGEGWRKLMVYAGEQSRHGGMPLYQALVRALRGAGAAGATSLRGIWGYHGDHAPHGDSLWQLRRRVPVVTVVVDRAERMAGWFELVDELTAETGLVTCENVPVAAMRSAESAPPMARARRRRR